MSETAGTGNCPECGFAESVSLDADRVVRICNNPWHAAPTPSGSIGEAE